MRNIARQLALIVALSLLVAGCRNVTGDSRHDLDPELTLSPASGDTPARLWIAKAKQHYRAGKYGHAERYFRNAVEEDQNNAAAWLGLAATYDRLRRFDNAERAYKVLAKLVGYTPTVLNNLGYHYMLRGDLQSAHQALRAARAGDPNNPHIRNNIKLLNAWHDAGKGRPTAG